MDSRPAGSAPHSPGSARMSPRSAAPQSFEPVGEDQVRANLSGDELELLRSLPEQLRSVLVAADRDPANDRLFPPAYLDVEDIEAQEEFRRLAQDDLLAGKLSAIELVEKSLQRAKRRGGRWTVELSAEEALAWLGMINDVRLTLGVRLEITDDLDGEVDDDDPRAPGLRLLYYLGWLEEHLLEAIPPR